MTTTTAPPGGHSAPLGLMSCVRESSPQDLVPQTDMDIERNETSKKRRFHPFRGLRKMFRRGASGGGNSGKVRAAASEEAVPDGDVSTTDDAVPKDSHRSRSTSELLAPDESARRKSGGGVPGVGTGGMYPGGGALSVSHDSVFTAEQHSTRGDSTSSDLDTAQSSSSLSIQQLMHHTGVRAELLDVVRRRGRGRGDTSEDEEDLGLPRSPCNSPTTTDNAHKDHPTKSHSTCSDGSLLSMGSSEMDEDSFGPQSRHSSKVSLHDRRPSNVTDSELELGTTSVAAPLSHSAARHKMSVRPKRTHGAPRRRRVQQLTAGSALPTTPEVNEETSTRSLTPEGSATRESIAELYSSSSTSMTKVWSGSVAGDTQLKSASLPPGLALPSSNKLSRSRSNAGTRAKEAFAEEDEPDDRAVKEDKKKEDSFFGRFLARRSGKKKKYKSEDFDDAVKTATVTEKVETTTNVSSYKYSEEKRTYSVDSGISKVARSGPAARQRIQPIDIPASPDAFRQKRQQHMELDLPMPPANSSPDQLSFLEASPPKKMHVFLPKQTKVTSPVSTSPEKSSSLSESIPIPTPRTILPISVKPDVIPSVRHTMPLSPEVTPAPRNIMPLSVSPPKTTWADAQLSKLASHEVKISEHVSKVEECKTKVKITGLSSYQQRVMSYNDEFDSSVGFKSLDDTSEDSLNTFAFTKSQSLRSKSMLNSVQDHSSLPYTVNSSIYDTTSDSETFTDSLMSTTTLPSTVEQQNNFTIQEQDSLMIDNKVKIINTNAETSSKEKLEKPKDGFTTKTDFVESSSSSVFISNNKKEVNEENIENKNDGITISCVNSQVQASVNTKSSNQVVVSISNPSESINQESNESTTSIFTSQSEFSIRESSSQVSVTKVQLKRDSKPVVVETPTARVPEFLKIQLNKVDAKPATNVVLSTSNSFGKADENPKQKNVLEIETDRDSGEVVTDSVKRKFSTDDVEIVEKEDMVEIPSKNITVSKVNKETIQKPNLPPLVINNNNQPRKSSLVSVSPVSPTSKPFLKKKSNSLELDSIKITEEKTKLASSSDQLSVIKTEPTKEKTSSSSSSNSDIPDTSPEVIMRKKSLGSQKQKDSDEPELMKVFARRSLKLKDCEVETLSQQVLVLVEDNNKNSEGSESNKRDSDKENEGSESPTEERKKSVSKETPKTKEPLAESKFVETADVTLRKPSPALNNKLSVFGGSRYPRTASLAPAVPNNDVNDNNERKVKSFIEPKADKKPVINTFKSPHIMKDFDMKKAPEITKCNKSDNFENEDYVPRFKRIQQRKEEWEQRAQQNMKKPVP